MSQENVRVSEGQQTVVDLLERPYPVHSGLLAPQEIRQNGLKRRNLISTEETIKGKEERKVRTNC